MNLHKVASKGQTFTFNVVRNLTEPCEICGVPACGKEDLLWYEFNGNSISIIFDGGIFGQIGEEFFKTTKYKLNELPIFLKQWHELEGWEDNDDYNGYVLNINDFVESIDLIKLTQFSEWLQSYAVEYLTEMKNIALKAKEHDSELKIVRG